jgi:flagellin-like protein
MQQTLGSAVGAAGGRARRRRRGFRRGRRGVSEVIATILILALTVTLFATIFAFVTSFPSPPAESVNQFQSSLSYAVSKSGGLYCGSTLLRSGTAGEICGLSILQTAGPVVYSDNIVYLESENIESNWQFTASAGIPVSWGIGNVSSGWETGMSWSTIFSPTIAVPDNITVAIVSSTTLLYRVQVSGASPSLPPVLTSSYTSPSNPAAAATFEIVAVITGSMAGLTANVSLGQIPGLSGVATMTCTSSAGTCTYTVAAGKTTTNGTYYAFVQGTSSLTLATISGSVLVKIGTTSGGGGGSSGAMSVTVGVSVQPPPGSSTTAVYFWAQVTEPSKLSGYVTVTFWINQTAPEGLHHVVSTKFYTSAATALKGPGSVTIYTPTTYGSSSAPWLFNSTVAIQAEAVGSSGISGNAVGTTTFSMPSTVSGEVCASSSETLCGADEIASFTYYGAAGGCTTTTCPYLTVYVKNSYGAALTVTAQVWANSTARSYPGTATGYTVASFAVASGASAGSYAATGMTNSRWLAAAAGTYTVAAWITVESGGVVIGYIYDTYTVTART